jgi:hypothetical protein
MLRKILTISVLLIFVSADAQRNSESVIYTNGNIKTLPYVQLYLSNANKSFQLRIFTRDTLQWHTYNGYYTMLANDSIELEYKQVSAMPVCKIVDTFHTARIINLLYIDENRKVVDTFSWECSNEPILINYFPLTYRDTSVADTHVNNITYVYYVPNFSGEMDVLFYKPEKQMKSFNVSFKMEKDKLIIDPKYKWLIEQYNELYLH